MSRTAILLTGLVGFVLFIVLIAFVSRDHDGAQQKKRDENVRLARLANGLPETDEELQTLQRPKAVAPQTIFDFGLIGSNESFTHAFEIRNEGTGNLELAVDKPSCTCVIAKSADNLVPPGGSTTIQLKFKPDGKSANVMQGVRIRTNDPTRKEIAFQIIGQTKQIYWLDKKEILFTDLQPDEARTQELRVYSVYPEGFEVLNLRATPAGLIAKAEPLSPDDVAQEANAKSGYKLIVSCSAEQRDFAGAGVDFSLRKKESEEATPYQLPVSGSRLGRLSVMGEPLDSTGRMRFGQLKAGEGKRYVYTMKVRGDNRELRVKELRTVPAEVKACIEPLENAATTGLYRLIIEFPKDLPEQSYMGKNAGRLEIQFEDEVHKPLMFQLQFAIVRPELLNQ